ncbi:transposase B [Escherichia coli M605]|uniref:Transposase B n=1 Tax=Escherichia coli M605 TaxID=656417 RepID=F4SY63_ECOLX|nr:transposase B [Escherichia coli M605]
MLNQSWSVDFMHDALVCGRRFRTFNVVDDFNREALSIEIDPNLPALRVVRVLDGSVANRGYPAMLRMDNGPEFISLALAEWAWSLSSRVSRRRTLSLSALTGHTVRKYLILSVQNGE